MSSPAFDQRRDPDRRRDQHAATPAGRCSDADGRVIGINTQIRSSGGGSVGVGFAVPVDAVRGSRFQQIPAERRGPLRLHRDHLTAALSAARRPARVPVDDGAIVAEVVEGGPADKAGIKVGDREIRFQSTLVKLGGDVVTKVNGRPRHTGRTSASGSPATSPATWSTWRSTAARTSGTVKVTPRRAAGDGAGAVGSLARPGPRAEPRPALSTSSLSWAPMPGARTCRPAWAVT